MSSMSAPAVMRCAMATLKPTHPRHCWCRAASIALWAQGGSPVKGTVHNRQHLSCAAQRMRERMRAWGLAVHGECEGHKNPL